MLILGGKYQIPWLGRFPGDISFEGKNISFYFPLTTCLIISLVMTLILWIINRR
ncbi:MAG: DUF2905 domain-containing protein [Syntrophales bacterium LBB04]|nr:DUF2905 domain-containing protein [Syntrophales bacterium LBB04]